MVEVELDLGALAGSGSQVQRFCTKPKRGRSKKERIVMPLDTSYR